jgi:pimeloyl-ACP methyl ester carboxylesterase
MSSGEYERYIDDMLDSLRQSGKRDVLIRIHGGLNDLRESPDADQALIDAMGADRGGQQYFPIFVNWESGLRSTYREHVKHIRQGQSYNNVWSWTTMPYYYGLDITKGVARLPMSAASTIRTFWSGTRYASSLDIQQLTDSVKRVHLGEGVYAANPPSGGSRVAKSPLLLVQIPASGTVDMFGTPAWDNMHRRTKTMFRSPNEFKLYRQSTPTYREPEGAVAILMRRLQHYNDSLIAHDPTQALRIVLVGHSMGTIIGSEIVRRYDLHYRAIVFMAAAASIRDFEMSILPYLESHPQTRFYNLTLHKYCELSEHHLWRLTPYGSLLVWLDDYITSPEADLDRTLGRWANIVPALHIVPSAVANQVYVKAFGYRDPRPWYNFGKDQTKPCAHGDFNEPEVKFWREETWTP